jgi:hypothetical protein
VKHEWSQARREQAFHNSGARFAEPGRFPVIPLIVAIFALGIIGVLAHG